MQLCSRKGEKGEYSAGYIPSNVRDEFINICKKKTGNILEIGCGEGLFISGLWQEAGQLKIFAVDIFKELLMKAKERLRAARNVHLVECDGQKLCFKDSAFDCVVCLNVLYNLDSIENVRQIIKEALRVVKRSQDIIVDIRNKKDFLTSLRFRLVKYYDYKIAVPLRQDNLEDILEIFKDNNAQVKEVIPIRAYFKLTNPVLIIRAKKL